MPIDTFETRAPAVPSYVHDELLNYEQQIARYRAGELDETKMQKLRLHFGTYAQRQEGVQMQRIKIPGGYLTADQLVCLADVAERYGSGFIHFTTREDAQIYYVKLEEAPELLRILAAAGITSREACGNTVRNITACYRSGTSATEAFDVLPYADALFRFLVRNKYNQNLGRKFKITFEGCADDHSALRIHDIGFWATTLLENGAVRRGFRVYLGGGLGASPHLAQVYSDFLPAEELFNLAAAALRLFDRYGERKARMKARMKFLIQTMGWKEFRAKLDEERKLVGPIPLTGYLNVTDEGWNVVTGSQAGQLGSARHSDNGSGPGKRELSVLDSRTSSAQFQSWVRDSVIDHKIQGFRGVHARVKLGDLTSERARSLASVSRRFSLGEVRISIEQNVYLPWVRVGELWDLYAALAELSLAEPGVGTIADVTACPGSDTCRLGIASAKGLGSALGEAFTGPLARYSELARPLRIKISGCPNGCAQHSIANIGFYAAALSHEERSVPAHFVTVGGQTGPENAQFGFLIGKFPAKNCVRLTEVLLELFENERLPEEDFNSFVSRVGTEHLKEILEPLRQVPSFESDPSFYEDYGHDHESFAVRRGVKGECAGSTVAETLPAIETASKWLAQSEALFHHKEFEHAVVAAYEAAAAAARVPLYARLVDPFTADEALWEFENLIVLSGQTQGAWAGVSNNFEVLKREGLSAGGNEDGARRLLEEARSFVSYCSVALGKVSGAFA